MLARRQTLRGIGAALTLVACHSTGPSQSAIASAGGGPSQSAVASAGGGPSQSAIASAGGSPTASSKTSSSDSAASGSGPAPPATRAVGHVLVVGGTGMLAGVTLELARRGHATTVIARRPGPLQALVERGGGRIHPLAVDYTEPAALVTGLEDAIARRGPLMLVVAWVHDTAPEAPLTIARLAAASGQPVRFVHVLGSAADDPSTPDPRRRADFEAVPGVIYREAILGFMIEDDGSRWLSDEEIVAGVLRAIDGQQPRSIVGVTRPWSARP